MRLNIDTSRFRDSFETYSGIGETDNGGLDRVALTEADRTARDKFVGDLNSLGLDVRIDRLGNIFGRRAGKNEDAAPVLIGSHLDSQPKGGRYDGQLGVLCALEAVRLLEEKQVETDRPIEIVNWTDEEGMRFNLAPLGSGTFVGKFGTEQALQATDDTGMSVKEALESIDYAGETPCEPYPIDSYLELHIEQGKRLERHENQIGVVSGVVGIEWLEVEIEGLANHAGTTPMSERRDALATTGTIIHRLRSLGTYFRDNIVMTVGDLEVKPGSINVIPGECVFTIDVRCYDARAKEEAIDRIKQELEAATKREATTYKVHQLMSTDPTEFEPRIQEVVREATDCVDANEQSIISRATHDAMYLNDITDAGLIFVPSVEGKSHTEEEYTEWEDVVKGANVYVNTVHDLANMEGGE